MEVNTNLSSVGAGGPIPAKGSAASTTPSAPKRTDSASLSTLDETLQNLPDSRAQAVARARSLVAGAQYPPPEVINKISELLAGKLTRQQP